jgi:hypothetical protein
VAVRHHLSGAEEARIMAVKSDLPPVGSTPS